MIKKQISHLESEYLFSEKFENSKLDFRFFTFEPGARIPEEGEAFHEEHEFSYILTGELQGESGGEPFHIKAGEASYIPAGEKHWSHNPTDELVTLLAVMLKED